MGNGYRRHRLLPANARTRTAHAVVLGEIGENGESLGPQESIFIASLQQAPAQVEREISEPKDLTGGRGRHDVPPLNIIENNGLRIRADVNCKVLRVKARFIVDMPRFLDRLGRKSMQSVSEATG